VEEQTLNERTASAGQVNSAMRLSRFHRGVIYRWWNLRSDCVCSGVRSVTVTARQNPWF